MTAVYRKRGSTVRYENGVMIRVRENGEAVDDGSFFRCAPVRGEMLPPIEDNAVIDAVREIRAEAGALRIERLIVTDGRVEHEMDGRSWSERPRRAHMSLVSGQHRLLIDEATLDVPDLTSIAQSFAKIGAERVAPVRLKLAARVTAALTRPLKNTLPPNVVVEQIGGGFDGKGLAVEQSAGPAWPNWYRPSYRVRPARAALNIALRCNVTTIEKELPEAVALLAPPEGATLRALIVHHGAVYPSTLRIIRFDAVTAPVRWFPYGAGVWAGEAEVVT